MKIIKKYINPSVFDNCSSFFTNVMFKSGCEEAKKDLCSLNAPCRAKIPISRGGLKEFMKRFERIFFLKKKI